MTQTDEMIMMLHQIQSPAFFVDMGVISHVNHPAVNLGIKPGIRVRELLDTGSLEYEEYRGGCLFLNIQAAGASWPCSVTRMNQFDLFAFEYHDDMAELKSMALAAQTLRGPLSNVMSTADRLFPLASAEGIPGAKNQLARINRSLFQMLRIISNMSDAYRYSQGITPELELRDIGSIMEELFSSAAPLIHHTGVELRFSNINEVLFTLVDCQMLERAVHNILSNALKFAPRGSTIEARLTHRHNMLFLSVSNNDPNCDGSFMRDMYRQYQRSPALEDPHYGIGLGMVLIRSAAAAHGGTVLVEQVAKKGTWITMSIAVRGKPEAIVRSPVFRVDYAGERNHILLELSECLPPELYEVDDIN